MSVSDFEALVSVAADAAARWESKGDPNWAARTYVQATIASLRVAVKSSTQASGIAYLEAGETEKYLQKAVHYYDLLEQEIKAGRLPSSVVGGSYHLTVLAHVGVLVGREDICDRVLAFSRLDFVIAQGPAFWNEYCHAFSSMRARRPYQPPARVGKRLEYWHPYLELIAALSTEGDATDSIERVSESFRRRNADRRFKDDQYGVEGSGSEPASWDFRLASLANR